jgi:saccharopine dehydrogenase-like NADP-dependent oxidoreductase
MTIVAVAGGLGDLGRLITDALLETGKHEVYILSRKVKGKRKTVL